MPAAPHNVASFDGPNLRLRLVLPQDAGFIHALRMDPAYNTHLSAVTGSADDQRAWIERYKAREAEGLEYYYIVERRDRNEPCGVVRIYDIEADRFTWGSWILGPNKTPKAALESAVLIYRIGFEALGKALSVFDVRNGNATTLAFHQRFGARETGRDEINTYFDYSAERFARDRDGYLALLGAL